jgi:SPW repeat
MATQYGGYTLQGRTNRWQNWANLILAIWLFISPWVLQFGGAVQSAANEPTVAVSHAAWNAWVLGVIVFLVALSAIGNMEVWQEWWNIVLGAWIFVAPWALGFVGIPRAGWDHWIVGALVFLLAIWSLSRLRNAPATAAMSPLGNRTPRDPVT